MTLIASQSYYFFGAYRLSQYSRSHQNAQETREAVPYSTAEGKRMISGPGKISGSIEFPLYDVTGPTEEMLGYYDDAAARGLILTTNPAADQWALVTEAYLPAAAGIDRSEGVSIQNLVLNFTEGRATTNGLNFYSDVGGSGITGATNGTSITFTGGIAAGKSMIIAVCAWNQSGGGTLDHKIQHDPLDTYLAATDVALTQFNASSRPDNWETVVINGPVTDPEYRYVVTAVGGGGTWYMQVAGAIRDGQ